MNSAAGEGRCVLTKVFFMGVQWFCMRLNVNMAYRHSATIASSRKFGDKCLLNLEAKSKKLVNEVFFLLQHGTVDRHRLVLGVLTTV